MVRHHLPERPFSDNGILYLSADDPGKLYAVDVFNGRVQTEADLEEHKGCCKWEEIEGLTVWDSNGRAPGITGQIHVVLLQQVGGDDNWIFKHFSAAPPF